LIRLIENKDLCQGDCGFLQPYLSRWDRTDPTSGHLLAFIDFAILLHFLLTIFVPAILLSLYLVAISSLSEPSRPLICDVKRILP
jgi:hypothetical protein